MKSPALLKIQIRIQSFIAKSHCDEQSTKGRRKNSGILLCTYSFCVWELNLTSAQPTKWSSFSDKHLNFKIAQRHKQQNSQKSVYTHAAEFRRKKNISFFVISEHQIFALTSSKEIIHFLFSAQRDITAWISFRIALGHE